MDLKFEKIENYLASLSFWSQLKECAFIQESRSIQYHCISAPSVVELYSPGPRLGSKRAEQGWAPPVAAPHDIWYHLLSRLWRGQEDTHPKREYQRWKVICIASHHVNVKIIMIAMQSGFKKYKWTEMNKFSLINLILVFLMLLFFMISKCSSK